MAFSSSMLLFLLCLFLSTSSSLAKSKPAPKQIVLPIYKDASTLQYLTQIKQRTPLVPVQLTVDLGGRSLWTDCEHGYISTSIRPGGCGTIQCRLAQASKNCDKCNPDLPIGPGCTNASTCWGSPENTVTRHGSGGELASDIITINSTDGKSRGDVVIVPQFLFYCGITSILEGLAKGVTGMAGLGRTKISFPVQLATALKLERKFGLCLSSSTTSNGVVILGDGPYSFPTNSNDSSFLTYTSLIVNKVNTELPVMKGEASAEYFIGVKSIKINNKIVNLNTTLLKINSAGFGGTKISTVNPYTVLETSIYNAVIKAFVNELKNVTRVPPVAPFGACFSSKNIGSTRVGPAVPNIDLVLEEKDVVWRMYGANTMVRVNKDVLCLGFVDGGEPPFITSIVIGGHQLEDNLLTFDLVKSRLGFSSSLLFRQTTCSNYRLTSNA
ncbi:Xyloglucan specific endoglucanase inhibitor [Heracleum sosnowskyi]|uniref:Xyloglucan specific endoglucanase inhibitor n=1 Tax=Heracleum sosnowskyi TaxID=360622 RepID=A0AAD8J020_9APIA|nr:Xyloglucan specific endoglucanase inhibitor [Heracleum sosnowskyi]